MKTAIIGLILIFIPSILLFMFFFYESNEPFAASQGGALVQLMAGKVYSENEMEEMLKYQKKGSYKRYSGFNRTRVATWFIPG